MNNYEAMILIRPDLKDEERDALLETITKLISNKDGQIQSADIWASKRKLAYEIRTTLTSGGVKRYNEALFYLIKFQMAPTAITQLRGEFKMSDSLIRVSIIKG